jgi:hypothetical protein
LKKTARALLWGGALLLGALVPAGAFAALQMNLRIFLGALVVTGAHALFLGVPATLLYRRQGWDRPLAAVTGGFVIGALPIGSILVLVGDRPTSLRWLLNNFEILGACGGLGALGAAVYWLTLKIGGALR